MFIDCTSRGICSLDLGVHDNVCGEGDNHIGGPVHHWVMGLPLLKLNI
jgi:hypothetical protein